MLEAGDEVVASHAKNKSKGRVFFAQANNDDQANGRVSMFGNDVALEGCVFGGGWLKGWLWVEEYLGIAWTLTSSQGNTSTCMVPVLNALMQDGNLLFHGNLFFAKVVAMEAAMAADECKQPHSGVTGSTLLMTATGKSG